MSQKGEKRNAHAVASNEFNKKAYYRFIVNVKKANEGKIKDRCEDLGGFTTSQYVNWLMSNDIDGFETIGKATKKGDKRK